MKGDKCKVQQGKVCRQVNEKQCRVVEVEVIIFLVNGSFSFFSSKECKQREDTICQINNEDLCDIGKEDILSNPNVTQLNSTQPKATVKAISLG